MTDDQRNEALRTAYQENEKLASQELRTGIVENEIALLKRLTAQNEPQKKQGPRELPRKATDILFVRVNFYY